MKEIQRRTFLSLAELALLPGKLFGFLSKKAKPSIGDRICFTILHLDCSGSDSAVVIINPCPHRHDFVPNSSGETLSVFDNLGCFLDEPEVNLMGRSGDAHYMQPDNDDPPQWVITTLACPEFYHPGCCC